MAQNSDADKRLFFNPPEDHSSDIRFSPVDKATVEGNIFATGKTPFEDEVVPISEDHPINTFISDAISWQPETAIEAVYKVAELLGEGGYGTVHRIYDDNLQMYLAVKTPLESTRSERFREREAYQLLDIGLHPNIASCIYVRTLDDGNLRLFIEYVSKKNLADLLNKNQITSLEMALDIGIQICWGLGWIHQRGLVHRDISPRNILMASNRQPKVADFGLVKPIGTIAIDDESAHEDKINSKRSLGGGTPGYAAPEQGQPDGVITLATDVYSVGVVLYEILQPWLGWPLFPDAEAGARPTFYRGALEKYESALAKILWCCLAFEPEERFQDANELADRLIEIYHELIGQPYQRKPSAGAELIADGLNNKAISLIHLKKPAQDVVACFEKALKSQPDHPETLYNACLYHWHLGQLDHYEKLLQQLRGLEREQPDNWRYPYLVGRLWLEQGYRDAAIPKLEAALIKSGGDGQVAQVLRGAKIPPEDCIPLQGHTDVVTAVAITPDGQQILSASLDKTVRLWDIKTGRHKILGEHTKGVNAIAISPDGRLGISGGDDGAIRVWDLISGECIQRVKWRRLFDSSITSVSLVKYFKSEYLEMLTIVTGSRTGRLGICDMKRWENDKYTQWSQSLEGSSPLRLSSGWVEAATAGKFRSTDPYRVEWQTFKTKYGPIKAMVAVPSIFEHRIRKDRILLANADQTPRLWYIGSDFYGYTKELIATFKGHTASVNAIAVSLDKEVSHLVLSGGDDHTLRRWYISEYLLYQDRTGYITIEGHTGPVTAVAISPNGSNFALSGSADKTVRLWRGVQVGPGTCLKIFQGHTDRVTSVAISPDGSWGVSASADQTLRLWRLENPKSFQPPSYLLVRPQDKDKTLGFGSLIAEAERCLSKGQLKEAGDLAERARQIPGYERSEQVVKFWAKLVKAWMRQAEQAWDEGHYKKAGYLVEQARQVPEYKNWWHTMDFTAKFARKGVRQGLYASRPVETIKGGNSIAISANGRCVLFSYDKTLHWWDLKNQECLKTLPEQPERINCIALFPDGRQAISGDEKGALYLWNVQQGHCLDVIPAHSGEVKAIAVSPNGQLVLSGGGAGGRKLVKRSFGELRLWKMTEGGLTRLGELKGHTDLITCVAISPDGRWGLSGGCDRTIRLWDLATGQCLRKFVGHTKWVQTVAFLPNNRYVLSTRSYLSHWPQHEYEEPVIWLWDIQRGRCLRAVGVWSESPSTALPLDNKWVYSEPGLWDLETGELRSEVTTFSAITASPDSRYIVDKNGMVHILDWTYEFPDPVDWDEGARPYLETFLTLEAASQDIEKIRTALASTHIPHLSDDDFETEDSPEDEAIPSFEYKFKQLLLKLSYGGYGWLRPEGVWRELQQMASVWEGPQPLPELFWMTKVLNLLSQIKVWGITFGPILVTSPFVVIYLLLRIMLRIMLMFVIFLIIAILVWLAWWISH